jgi:antibiotic biosynthesis monooxygenase (ABM) superfamily enzyme
MSHFPTPARILVTFCAICPLVLIVSAILRLFTASWPGPYVTILTLAIVVPNAVLWAVPLLTKLYMKITGGTKKNRQLIPNED